MPGKNLVTSATLLAMMAIPSVSIAEKTYTHPGKNMKIGGRFMYDFDLFDGAHNNGERGSESELRRAQIYIKSRFDKEWLAKIELSYDDEEDSTKLKDAYLRYQGWDFADITIGKSKEPFGLENTTSSKFISTIERSMPSSAFAVGRNYGVALTSSSRHKSWGFGLFEAGEDENGLDTYSLSGRYTISPINKADKLLHFGIGASVRDWGGAKHEIEESAEVNTADEIVFSSKLHADTINQLGLEAAWVGGAWSMQAEWFKQQIDVKDEETIKDAHYSGYYVQANYFLTGESRNYKDGRFTRTKPYKPCGAWELVSRYSLLDAVDNDEGVKASNSLLGLTYYANKKTRFMANMIHTELDGPDSDDEGWIAMPDILEAMHRKQTCSKLAPI